MVRFRTLNQKIIELFDEKKRRREVKKMVLGVRRRERRKERRGERKERREERTKKRTKMN